MRKLTILLVACLIPLGACKDEAQKPSGETTQSKQEVPAEQKESMLKFSKPYTYATVPGQKNGAIFFELKNEGAEDDKIIAAASDVAERTELHTHMIDGGILMMRKIGSYDAPAGGTLTLKPAGHHIMLMNLKEPLAPETTIKLNVTFENAGVQTLDVPVLVPGTKP